MEATAHDHHHDLPTSGGALNAVALSATLHCLTGCAIGEVTGMVIGTALGFSDWGTVALAVALAFLFGYSLTSLPLLRAGLALSTVIPIALATDTFSIAVMEIVDNAIMLIVPGAMEAGVGDVLFWGALSFALVVAGVVAWPVNRWLITKGRGHAVLHNSGHHPNFPTRAVAAVAAVMAVFGTTVLVVDAFTNENEGHGGGHQAMERETPAAEGHGAMGGHGTASMADPVRGLSDTNDGMTLQLATTHLEPGEQGQLRFQIVGDGGTAVRDYEVEHEKRMHLIVARKDLTGFQHLHPRLGAGGSWTTPVTVEKPGDYRVFADFKRHGTNQTLATDLNVDGGADARPLPAPATTATTEAGYEVNLAGTDSQAGRETELAFTITRDGATVKTARYLGAGGHLVALRKGDLAYLHTHPAAHGNGDHESVAFETEFPSEGRYRLFLQFKHAGQVHTAAFTREVTR